MFKLLHWSTPRRLLQRNLCDSSKFRQLDSDADPSHASNFHDLLDDSTLGSGHLDETTLDDAWLTSPYPPGTVFPDNNLKTLRPQVNPRDTSIILFPGHGSQYIGMGRDLLKYAAVRDIIDASCSILQVDMLKYMQNGPLDKLNDLGIADPAIFITSLASLEKLKEERPWAIENCVATAGLGVGEISALTFAGVFSFPDGLKLVKARAEALKVASETIKGGMSLVHTNPGSKLKQAMAKAREWCSERGINDPVCQISCYLCPDLRLISGHNEALRYVECNLKYYNLEKYYKLPVQGPYHTRLMALAAYHVKRKLDLLTVNEPILCVHSNLTGSYFDTEKQIRDSIPKSLCHSIKWENMLNILYEKFPEQGYPETIICGPKNELDEYLRRMRRKAAEYIFTIHA